MIYNKPVYMIAALDAARGIGLNGSIPWFLPSELAYFHATTSREHRSGARNLLIVGRKTWESIPASSHHKFANRQVVVLSRNPEYVTTCAAPGAQVEVAHTLEQALQQAATDGIGAVYVIGGAQLYQQFISDVRVDELLITHLLAEFDCDLFFPEIPPRFANKRLLGELEEKGMRYQFTSYSARNAT